MNKCIVKYIAKETLRFFLGMAVVAVLVIPIVAVVVGLVWAIFYVFGPYSEYVAIGIAALVFLGALARPFYEDAKEHCS